MSVINIQNIGKKYSIRTGSGGSGYLALRDVLAHVPQKLMSLFSEHQPSKVNNVGDFWAVKDVNIEVQAGEKLGIIGHNGAGKSTLLKVLSRITQPTIGRVVLKGRVASLLEVGTGFHPELTGRENIFMNGAILGMTRADIKMRFDEIVDFAGVDRFVDLPVKRYSSGMRVRLGFSVAAHLEPDILIVDEVLAVGDAAFQQKCLGKLDSVSQCDGRTVLFVSHNMASIQQFCSRVVLLKNGRVVGDGKPEALTKMYVESCMASNDASVASVRRKGSGGARFIKVEYLDESGGLLPAPSTGKAVTIRLHVHAESASLSNCRVGIGFNGSSGRVITATTEMKFQSRPMLPGRCLIDCCFPKFPLVRGPYSLVLFLESDDVILDWIADGIPVVVEGGHFYGDNGCYPHWESGMSVLVDHDWVIRNA